MRQVKTLLIPSLVVTCALLLYRPARPSPVSDAFVTETKAYFEKLEKFGFAGALVVTVNGEPVIAEGYGLANRELGIEWTPNTISTIGSITKQFTAAAILVLEERGKLHVEDPIAKHFDGVPEDKQGITLHHLLSHSSGIVDLEGIGDFDAIDRDEYVRRHLEAPLAFPPGEGFEYANANFSLLGAIIEQQTGKSYEEAMRELIFLPAGLEETGYLIPQWDAKRLAQGYEGKERWGTVLERPMADDGPFWALRANGGIYSSAEEMVHWVGRLLAGEVLSAESREKLWTPHVAERGGGGHYAYGWSIQELPSGERVVTHNGGNGILFADLAIVPDHGVVAFIQTNVISDFSMANGLLNQIGERLFGNEPYPYTPDITPVDSDELKDWAGSYSLSNGEHLEVSVDSGALRVLPEGWTAYAWVHSTDDVDPEKLVELSREIDRIVGAYVGGDFAPLYEAYRREVPLERLENMYRERLEEREAEFGPFKEYEVLGTGTYRDYYFTLVRFIHDREELSRVYVWDRSAEKKLLGITGRRVGPAVRFYPVGGGATAGAPFESWDGATGTSVSARFEATSTGKRIRFARGDREVVATR